ncbi:hypothetical protein KDH_65210 [Dictyobacter sp. S3.2.2.5]|uniref:Uncharacterized protein n=1 Tax=Dictyobacter halimunensis TaxID=3026934 RepID=A0ABQ6G4X7_9CHLR|nr:hypothetical protein KDH_65210 [Dictyobacter sp. S3.2.2.5]
MHLYDTLQICLYALENRYPNHIVDINADIIESQGLPLAGWKAPEVVEILSMFAPQWLQTDAVLIIDYDECAIYLPDVSQQKPLCTIHCHGKIPPHIGDGRRWLTRKQPAREQTIIASSNLLVGQGYLGIS